MDGAGQGGGGSCVPRGLNPEQKIQSSKDFFCLVPIPALAHDRHALKALQHATLITTAHQQNGVAVHLHPHTNTLTAGNATRVAQPPAAGR